MLLFVELSQRMLITFNRISMPEHLKAHWAAGGHICGLFWVRPETSIGQLAKELYMFWEASEAEEWVDRTGWIPF